MKKITIFSLIFLIAACGHYTTAGTDNVINAPPETVWENTLQVLPTENIQIVKMDKEAMYIEAEKPISLMSTIDLINIQLIPKGSNQTIFVFDARAGAQLIGWGHQERLTKQIFQKIKELSEN